MCKEAMPLFHLAHERRSMAVTIDSKFEAVKKAEELLLSVLSDTQKATFQNPSCRYFHVLGSKGGAYQIGATGYVYSLKGARPDRNFCIHFSRFAIRNGYLPTQDFLAGVKLMIEADEDLFLKTAHY